MALLVMVEAMSFDIDLRVAPSVRVVDLENVLHELVAKHNGYTCATTSFLTARTTFRQYLLFQHVRHDRCFRDIELV
jgi:hypothetical protein